MKTADVCAVVLAGGRSLRMGRDKALLEIDGTTLIERQVNLLRDRFGEVAISSNDEGRYAFLGLPIILDVFVGQGPLAGLHAAMLYSQLPLFLLIACDMPRVPAGLLDRLLQESGGYDAVVPRTTDGQAHPLCGVYRRTLLDIVARQLSLGCNSFLSLLGNPALRVCWLHPAEGGFSDSDMCNLNAPEDLSDYIRRLSSALP